MNPTLIDTSDKMNDLVSQLQGKELIAVDTEFQRETTYYPQLALVQIATEDIVVCIDPLAFDAKPSLKKLLLDEKIIKIFHSCSQDLEVLYYYLGSIPNSIYDTQIANALLNENQQISYAALVENELAIELDKSQTRTNWLQRPLTKKQIQYAGDDVFYLYQLHKIMDQKLEAKSRNSWFNEECSSLASDDTDFHVNTEQLWKRVKHATRLPRNKLAIVQAIAVWREKIAQKDNKTRKRILQDDAIVQLAESPRHDMTSLNEIIDKQHHFSNEVKSDLLEIISKSIKTTEDEWPDNRFNALEGEQKKLLKDMQKIVNTKAEELGISSTLLFSRKELEKIILQPSHLSDKASTWRYQCIGQELIAIT